MGSAAHPNPDEGGPSYRSGPVQTRRNSQTGNASQSVRRPCRMLHARSGAREEQSTQPRAEGNTSQPVGRPYGMRSARNGETHQASTLLPQQAEVPAPQQTARGNHRTQDVHERTHASNRREMRQQSHKSVKAAIKIASLNMRGNGSSNPNHPNYKWNHVNQIMRDEEVGIMILQETHMNDYRHNEVQKLFSKKIKIFFSANPINPTRRGGVAIVLNRRYVPTEGAGTVRTTEIAPGRALLMKLKLSKNRTLAVLTIYAPNSEGENRDFWIQIRDYFESHLNIPKPDLVIGDFNMVEDIIDQLPAHKNNANSTGTIDAFDKLKQSLNLHDGWRTTFPSTKAYTYLQSGGHKSQSRIDRIYVKPGTLATA